MGLVCSRVAHSQKLRAVGLPCALEQTDMMYLGDACASTALLLCSSAPREASSPPSPLSSSSTVDDGESSSPILPPLPVPRLPDRVLEFLRTPPPQPNREIDEGEEEDEEEGQYITTSWGSPYPHADSNHLRRLSFSSEGSDESPLHQLELSTPFLRPVPLITNSEPTLSQSHSSLSGSAAVLANRARRPLGGITEEWIRQHTIHDLSSEHHLWLSDGTDDSERSSLSGSLLSNDASWAEENHLRTPRATLHPSQIPGSVPRQHPRNRSSNETLRQAILNRRSATQSENMDSLDVERSTTQDAASIHTIESNSDVTPRPVTPTKSEMASMNGSAHGTGADPALPATPARPTKPTISQTPRLKKKVPWKGKNIMVLLPRDEERGQPGKAPIPLDAANTESMLRSWEQLGYDISGFDLDGVYGSQETLENNSRSRAEWPKLDDIAKERSLRQYHVSLPDLNAWRDYVSELAEAKLRALGPSPSPAPSNLSRQASNQFALPFSPPLPTPSAASNGPQAFPFPTPFLQVASPLSFNGHGHAKFNPRASISISPHELPYHLSGQPSPMGWSPQLLLQQQQLARGGSPSVLSMMSPGSPFSPDGISPTMGIHQRHQSLQYPMLPHQFLQRQDSARASPRLQEVREDEEETQTNPYDQSPSKTPEPAQSIQHNASNSLQKEIDEAEYHLEEQFRSQLEHEDYSPHNEAGSMEVDQGPSVHFSGIGTDSDEGPKLHHPQPHSRGHSLSQNPTDEGSIRKPPPGATNTQKADNSYEAFGFVNQPHQRSLSMASNPWADSESHTSKSSLSKLNAGAAEFNQFVFGGKNPQAPSFTPTAYQASAFSPALPQSTTSSHFSVPSNGSSAMGRINPTAPAFSPHRSDFSFSASGPKFNPDAKAFQPMPSGNEIAETRPSSIFGNISLSGSEFVKPVKNSKAIPIVRPSSPQSPAPVSTPIAAADTPAIDEGRVDGGASRLKKQFRDGDNADGDDVPQFAEPTPEPESVPETELEPTPEPIAADKLEPEKTSELEVPDVIMDVKDNEDETVNVADITLASTVLSESTDGKPPSESNDTKATTSPSATSPDPDKANWRPIEFANESEIHDFNNARPFGDEEPTFEEEHKPHFSAAAKPFVPGGFMFGAPEMADRPFEPDFMPQPAQLPESIEDSEEDRAGSPTPGPEFPPPTNATEAEESQQSLALSPEPAPTSARGLLSSRFASPPPAPKGLKASRFAASPSPPPRLTKQVESQDAALQTREASEVHSYEPLPVSPPSDAGVQNQSDGTHELTFEEIDAVMQQINENDPNMGVKRTVDSPKWHQPSPVRKISVAAITNSPPVHMPPQVPFRSEAPGPSPPQYRSLPKETVQPRLSTELEDPFVDPHSAVSQSFDAPVQCLNAGEDLPESEWDDAFSASEQGKLEQRVQYFDGHVNDLVGNILASRLDPLEKTLSTIQHVLGQLSQRAPSSRRDRRSISAEIQESDADDEDEELPLRRSMSPKRDRRMEQIRIAVVDAMNQHQSTHALESAQFELVEEHRAKENSAMMKALEDMKLQITESIPNFRSEDLRNIVEEAVQNRIPPPPAVVKDDDEANVKLTEMQSKIYELEQRLRTEESKSDAERLRIYDLEEKLRVGENEVESERTTRRAAEDRSAELRRQLEQAETKVEVEIMNRSVFDQRIHDLEERLKSQEGRTEFELSGRREAEDRLSEIQRLLRISSEEEDRLRAVLDERDQMIKSMEQSAGKTSMRLTLLEAAQANAEQTQAELKNRLNVADVELRDSRQEARHWRSEAEHARESATRQADDFVQSINENKHLHKLIDTLGVQLEENERIRDNWRAKFVSLQNDMAHAAREITEENSRRSKKEQALIARQEVLDARLQAEARTRERLEVEVERLENGERAGMRAVSECKRLEGLLTELRNDNHDLHQQVLRTQREAQEARDSATSERQRCQLEVQEVRDSAAIQIQRAQQEVQEAKDSAFVETQQVRESVSAELEAARDQVNIVKADFEEELAKLRAQLDQVRMDADTAKVHHEMMFEEAQNSKHIELEAAQNARETELDEISRKYQNEIEDLQVRYERQISNAAEDAQRTEQNLLERLSLSASKIEHLQDRVAHLEEKVQIAQEAAKAAAQAAAQASRSVAMPEAPAHPGPVGQTKQLAQAMQLPEKISPQALRESIMVLQEQLQAREQRIEELEQTISKRDDEITWLRELLAVRHGDLQDIIAALSATRYDREAVKDAAIRLKANLQMEEQERERAMNGGSALNLPNIAATISKAATPRVAQAVGPLAAAWGNWRRSNQSSLNLSGAMSSPAPGRNATPSKSNSVSSQNRIRNTPQAELSQSQPTAFGTTGRRYTAEQFANRARRPSTARRAETMPLASTPPPRQDKKEPRTPPMMQSGSYDDDARMEEFDDASFFDD
ncbi:hypothetical protein F5Y19DRAFT_466039 [Xylariaceae sp. FL1651]|nr:hypothetical protein F5Y19DRAFT_466039 [Xylariaceae sp. FL1651]